MSTSIEVLMSKRSRSSVILTSIALILSGLVGMALPQLMSIAMAFFAGWLMIVAGVIAIYITWHGLRDHLVAWLKPFALVAVGLLVLLHPVAGAAALGLVLAVFFLFSGFAGVASAWDLRPRRGWGWLMFNGILSLVLAAVFISSWPFSAAWLVGLFIGISLFFDGLSLLMIGLAAKPS